jgi:hypothetical protein
MPTLQKPVGSGFGTASTADDVIKGIDLSDGVAIVTGGYSGIGLETTRALRSPGAKVIVPARDHDKAASALEGLGGVEIEAMDLIGPGPNRCLRPEGSCLRPAAAYPGEQRRHHGISPGARCAGV